MDEKQYTDQELLELIRGNKDNLKYVYKNTKDYAIRFIEKIASGSDVSDDDLQDIYNDAIIVLYEKIRDGKFKLTSSFQTYLNSVCRNLFLNKLKKIEKDKILIEEKKKEVTGGTKKNGKDLFIKSISDILEPIPDQKEQKFNAMEKAMITIKEAGGKCFELLTMFWYQKKSMNYIASKFGYTNAATAKNQKAKCQKRLKKLAFKYL